MTEHTPEFADDLLRGAHEVAQFLYGGHGHALRRKVYHLVATSNLPVFKLGSMICARKSVILKWIEDQELRHANDNYKPNTTSEEVKTFRTAQYSDCMATTKKR